jgi:uncharacterized protein YndB with AHSA1/START domain
MTIRREMAVLALACAIAPQWLAADIVDSSATGFTVKETVNIQAPPQDVYTRIFRVSDWWSSAHTFSQDAHNLSMEDKVGGCFCEKLPNGGAVKHMEVVNMSPSKTIVLRGTLGPLQTMAATGSMQIQLTPADGGTKVEVTYAVGGYLAAGLNTWAGPVDGVLKQQFTRLKNAIEKGDPAAK